MTKAELIDRFADGEEQRILLARVLDKAELARSRSIPAHTHFLSAGEQAAARQLLASGGYRRHQFYGGFEGAERAVCVFLPDWQEEFIPGDEDDPLAAIETPIPPGSGLTHRDFLGSMMGLGLTRDLLGDILVGKEKCQVVLLRRSLPILLSQWSEVGRYPAKPREIPLSALEPVAPKIAVVRDTFQSLRFDAVSAAAFGLPRSRAASLISGGKLLLNHQVCEKPDRILAEGDVLTGRGLGKCVLRSVTGQSKKGRIMVELEKYQ